MTTDRLADPGPAESPTGPEAAAQVEGIDPRTLRAGDVMTVELMTVDADEGLLLTWNWSARQASTTSADGKGQLHRHADRT